MRVLIIKILLRLANPFRVVDSEGEPLDIDGMWLDHERDRLVIQVRVEPPAPAADPRLPWEWFCCDWFCCDESHRKISNQVELHEDRH